MKAQHRAAIMLLIAALVVGPFSAGAGASLTRAAATGAPLSGSVTIDDSGSYSNNSQVADDSSHMTCKETIDVHQDGSATETIDYSYHEVDQQTNNGYETKHTVDIAGSGTVQYDPDLYVTIDPNGTYYLGLGTADPGIAAKETVTFEQTGEPTRTIQTTAVVHCQYNPNLLQGKLSGGPVLKIDVSKDGYWNTEEDHNDYGPSTLIVNVDDPSLGQGHGHGQQPQPTPQPSQGCSCKSCSKQDAHGAGAKGSAARPALAVPGVSALSSMRATHLGDTRMAQGHYGCQWYGTVHVLKAWHSAKRLLVLPPSTPRGKPRTVYSVEGQCEESLVFSPPDRVTAALNYFEWHNTWEPYVKDIGTLIQTGMTSLIPNWTSPKLNGKLPFGPYTTRPMDGKLIQTGDDVTARDIQIGVHDATVAWDINGAMVQEKSGNRTIKLNEHTAECYPVNFRIDPTHPKDKIGPIHGSYRDTDGTVYPADSYIDWDLYQQK